jgi:hypothetical protein
MMEMTKALNCSNFSKLNEPWDLSFFGEVCDDRTKVSTKFCVDNVNRSVLALYSSEELSISFNKEIFQCYQIEEFIRENKPRSVLLDATSLGVAELGLLLKIISKVKKLKCSILYIEPGSYVKDCSTSNGLNVRDFSLSVEIGGYKGIPTLSRPLNLDDNKVVVFFLGFESYRLKHALEELNITPKQCSLVFGVPSFKPGWEVDAFANNIKCISDNDLGGRVYFCGADNPAAVFYQLKEIREMIGDDEEITVIPIGSKPHSIGALIYCSSDLNTNMVYDHPIKNNGRTTAVGPAHMYKLIK